MIVFTLDGRTPGAIARQATAIVAAWSAGALPSPEGRALLEVRLDRLLDSSLTSECVRAARRAGFGIIATARRRADGGDFDGSECDRLDLLRRAAQAGAGWVDLEWPGAVDSAMPPHVRVIVSHHDLQATEPRWTRAAAALRRSSRARDGVAKLALAPKRAGDLPALVAGLPSSLAFTAFAIGDDFELSRWRAFARGGWLYACGGDAPAAPGQPPAAVVMRAARRCFAQPGRELSLFAVTGSPVRHSLSPLGFEAAFDALGAPAVYRFLPSADAGHAVALAHALRIEGLSVTAPLKVAIVPYLDELTPIARAVGAVNTVSRAGGGRLIGDNTDVFGFLAPLRNALAGAGAEHAIVLGAGGAARAAAVACQALGARVIVVARRRDRAKCLTGALGVVVIGVEDLRPQHVHRAAIVVNTTPLGGPTVPGVQPLAADLLHRGQVVMDVAYRPPVTPWLGAAAARGCRIVTGLEMFLAQARAQCVRFGMPEPEAHAAFERVVKAAVEADWGATDAR